MSSCKTWPASPSTTLGSQVNAMVRGKPVTMEVVAMPFVPTHYFRG